MSLLVVSSGHAISGYQATSGNQVDVLSGGLARYTTLSDFGVLSIFGVDAYHTTISNGGYEIVQSGSHVRNDIIQSGGSDLIENGAYGLNETVGSGGLLTVDDSALQRTTVSSGGELNIAVSAAQVAGTQIELGGKIDLSFLPFSSGTTSATINTGSDQLTVTDGGSSFVLQLAGGYHKGHFVVEKDHSGTAVFYRYGSAASSDQSACPPLTAASALPNASVDLSSAAGIARSDIAAGFIVEAKKIAAAADHGFASGPASAAMSEAMVHNGGFIEALPHPS